MDIQSIQNTKTKKRNILTHSFLPQTSHISRQKSLKVLNRNTSYFSVFLFSEAKKIISPHIIFKADICPIWLNGSDIEHVHPNLCKYKMVFLRPMNCFNIYLLLFIGHVRDLLRPCSHSQLLVDDVVDQVLATKKHLFASRTGSPWAPWALST